MKFQDYPKRITEAQNRLVTTILLILQPRKNVTILIKKVHMASINTSVHMTNRTTLEISVPIACGTRQARGCFIRNFLMRTNRFSNVYPETRSGEHFFPNRLICSKCLGIKKKCCSKVQPFYNKEKLFCLFTNLIHIQNNKLQK